ncbi:MAG: YWFCY domain-containing protein [Flavobacteriales bacterium AspAUS03]
MISYLGANGIKNEKLSWNKILIYLVLGLILFFFNFILLRISTLGYGITIL